MAPHHKQQRNSKDDLDAVFSERPTHDYRPTQLSSPLSSTSRYSDTKMQAISITASLWTLVSLFTYLADVLSDIYVSGQYYTERRYWWFGFGLGFVVVASIAMQVFSLKWFYDDGKRQNCATYALHVVQMGPLIRYWTALKLCWKSLYKGGIPQGKDLFVAEWRDLSMLRLLHAFLQSAPQLVLQLYVIARRGRFIMETDLSSAISACTSLISIIWAILCYSKALRDMRPDPGRLPCLGFIFQMLWRTSMITSRVVALVLFASYFTHWMFVAAAAHWLIMALWLSCQRTQFCIDETGREHPCREKLFNGVIAFIYIFCFFNTKEGMTRKRVVLFYSVMLVENSLLISMWYPHRTLNTMLTYVALITVWGGFVLGIVFMILYYRFYHHSRRYKGIFLRKRKIEFENRQMYGLYCCCCCRIRRWELADDEDFEELSGNPRLLLNRTLNDTLETEDDNLLIPPSQEAGVAQGNVNWEDGDFVAKPANGDCSDGFKVTVHNGGVIGREDDADVVPNIVITSATPTVLSPHESPRSSEIRTPSPEHEHLTREPTMGDEDERGVTDEEEDALLHDEDEDVVIVDVPIEEPKSPSPSCPSADVARRILADKLGNTREESQEEEVFSDHDDLPKINYGSLSFSNRYSLVSSDCISLSSGSSLSSFNSLNDILDHADSSSDVAKKTESRGLKRSVGDEGIFSDDRESPAKSTPEKLTEVNTIAFAKDVKKRTGQSDGSKEPQACPLVDNDGVEIVELIMDAPSSPYPSRRTVKSSSKGESLGREERSESESTESSSEGNCSGYDRHSCSAIYVPDSFPSDEYTMKRHSLDFAELSRKSRKSKKRERERKRRKYGKLITFDSFVASPLKAGKYGSLRKSFERLSKIQEDGEEWPFINDDKLVLVVLPPMEEEKEDTTTVTDVTTGLDKKDLTRRTECKASYQDENKHKEKLPYPRKVEEEAVPWIKKPVQNAPTSNERFKSRHEEQLWPTEGGKRASQSKAMPNGSATNNEQRVVPKESNVSKALSNKPERSLDEDLGLPSKLKREYAQGKQTKKELNTATDKTISQLTSNQRASSPDEGHVQPVTNEYKPIPSVNLPRDEDRTFLNNDQRVGDFTGTRPDESRPARKENSGMIQESYKRPRLQDDDNNELLPPGNASPKRQLVKQLPSVDLYPSKLSTVRRSCEAVTLASAEDLDDLSDLYDSEEDTEIANSQDNVADISSKSIFKTNSSKGFLPGFDRVGSSESSAFGNPLFSMNEQHENSAKRKVGFEEFGASVFPDTVQGLHSDKRHTFAFESTGRGVEKGRTLIGGNSLPLHPPDSPIWVHSPDGANHRRRRPGSHVSADVPLQEDVIQEVRV